MEKKYTVKEFCDKYDNDEIDLTNLKYDTYVPYEQKIDRAAVIVKVAYYNKMKSPIDGREAEKMHLNSPAAFLFYCLTIIDLYTEISVNFKDPDNEFNALNSRGLIDTLLLCIDEHELKEFQMVFDLTKNDTIANNNFQTYVENQIERVLGVLTPIVTGALNQVDGDKIIQAMDRFRK